MPMKEISQAEFQRLCPQAAMPPATTEMGWYATDGNEFAAVIVRYNRASTWEYLVFKPGPATIRVASSNSFHSRPEPELRGRLQELLFRRAVESSMGPTCPDN